MSPPRARSGSVCRTRGFCCTSPPAARAAPRATSTPARSCACAIGSTGSSPARRGSRSSASRRTPTAISGWAQRRPSGTGWSAASSSAWTSWPEHATGNREGVERRRRAAQELERRVTGVARRVELRSPSPADRRAWCALVRTSRPFFAGWVTTTGYLGYYIGAAFAGQGYMTEGLQLMLRNAFGGLGLRRVEANIQPGNRASLRLVRRAGFRREGVSPRYLKIAGRWRDHERWALLREDWRALGRR